MRKEMTTDLIYAVVFAAVCFMAAQMREQKFQRSGHAAGMILPGFAPRSPVVPAFPGNMGSIFKAGLTAALPYLFILQGR